MVLDRGLPFSYNRRVITRRGVDVSVPLDEREQFHRTLRATPPLSAVVLATCDRIEVYEGQGMPDEADVLHLFRVVSGLESPMLGENQIQGQVKRAYEEAKAAHHLDSGLHRLFQQALRVGKRVRTETKLSQGATGHAQTVVQLLKTLPVPLSDLRLLVIGVNNLSRGILRFLTDKGSRTFFLGNRTLEKAQALVADLGAGVALPFDHLGDVLPGVDVVISSTAAPHLIVRNSDLPPTGGPRWFFDLAVPRDIDPEIAHRPDTVIYNITDMEEFAKKSLKDRQDEVVLAERILDEELAKFFSVVSGAVR
jgi:glutamyl-tRNA reductase